MQVWETVVEKKKNSCCQLSVYKGSLCCDSSKRKVRAERKVIEDLTVDSMYVEAGCGDFAIVLWTSLARSELSEC